MGAKKRIINRKVLILRLYGNAKQSINRRVKEAPYLSYIVANWNEVGVTKNRIFFTKMCEHACSLHHLALCSGEEFEQN